MSQMTLAQFIDTQCIPRLSASAVYQDVRFAKRGFQFLQGMCPFGSERTPPGSFVVDARTLRWSCLHHCGRAGQSVLAYLNGGHAPRPETGEIAQSIQKLAQLAGIPLASFPSITAEAEQELAARERVVSLLESFLALGRRRFAEAKPPVRRSLVAWLARSGLDAAGVAELGLGVAGELSETRRELEEAGFSPQEIDASSLADDPRLVGRLIGPIRDRHGCLLSIWARDPEDRAPKFLFKGPWRDFTPLAGLDAVFAGDPSASGVEHVIVFERLFDALVLNGLGWAACAAIVGPASDMTPVRWQQLAELGVRRVTLVPDDSEPSRQHAWTAVENASKASVSPEVWVLAPEALRPHSSGVALARARGVARLQSLVKAESVHGFRYKALMILRRHQPASGWTEPSRHAAWKEAIEFHASSPSQHAPMLDAHFVPAIEAGLQRTWETFEPLPSAEMAAACLRITPRAEANDRDANHASTCGCGGAFRFVHGSHDAAPLRPPISRPAVAPVAATTGKTGGPLARESSPHHVPRAAIQIRPHFPKTEAICAVHHCDTLQCFCFD